MSDLRVAHDRFLSKHILLRNYLSSSTGKLMSLYLSKRSRDWCSGSAYTHRTHHRETNLAFALNQPVGQPEWHTIFNTAPSSRMSCI